MTCNAAPEPEDVEQAEGRSKLYAFMAGLFRAPPGEVLLALLADEGCPQADGGGIEEIFGEECRDTLAVAAREGLAQPDALRQDFEDLLKVPAGKYLAPYESAYRGQPASKTRGMGLLMGPHAREVAALYRLAGLATSGDCKELPDHVSLELEFLSECAAQEARLLRAGEAARAEAEGWRCLREKFLAEHVVQWVPELCSRMRQRADTGFYRAVGQVVPELLGRGATLELEQISASHAAA